MEEIREKEKFRGNEIFMNPYVVQMDKFADSLKHLSKTFLKLEGYKGTFTKEELEEMFEKVTDKVCRNCENREMCLGEKRVYTYQAMHEILCAAVEYGAELNIELKRKLKSQCILAPRFLRETLEVFENAKEILMWNNRMVQNREGYAGQLKSFAKMIQYTTRELDAGIFEDEHMEKRLKTRLKKAGIRMLSAVFYMTPQGKYEIHLTVKAMKGQSVSTRELVRLVGDSVGREMMPGRGERPVIGEDYCTVACMEGARFHTLQGVARIGKGCEKISGDTFLMTELPGGKQGIALSDGMGSGEDAFRESSMVVEMLEELLGAGFPVKTAVQMMNTALVIGREEVRFCTVDVTLFDLYEGACEFVKAGAAATFLKRQGEVEIIRSATLPIGVLQDIEIDTETRRLESGDYVIMVTDGVMDALPAGEQDVLMCTFIQDTDILNPRELAHHILGRVLEWSGEVPLDDMTVLVAGLWSKA
ncbi:SpoIIE family protein phosphatase [Merdimonas faecis]|uniref:SpoIIE family protein phosphatase n=1 Tax=Merdimonas faecis TaxID=1653435 RepID=UPI0023F85093|nr:SpoIIE family protein phosphatase [Merdimonas faecis]